MSEESVSAGVKNFRNCNARDSFELKYCFEKATKSDIAALDQYINSGGDINGCDEHGLGLLHHAACRGDLVLASALVDYGADINLSDQSRKEWRPIHFAIFHNHMNIEQYLLACGARPLSTRFLYHRPLIPIFER